MAASREEVFERVKEVLVEQLGVDENEVTEGASFQEDLDADSLDLVDFRGNVESRWLLAHAADVVVCDGFTGNVALKLLEGTIRTTLDWLRTEITATARGKAGGALIKPAAARLRSHLDPDTYGGAYLLGLRGLCVIAHGNSSRRAIANAVRFAARGIEHRVVDRLADRMAEESAEERVSIRALSESNPQER